MESIQFVGRKSGAVRYRFEMPEEEFAEIHDDGAGACIACGADTGGVEPDARAYECEACGERKVYGLEELLVMGYIRFVGEA
jgi:hypothetical protein